MPYLREGPIAMAHRGGVALPVNAGIENSVKAFRNAVDLGYRYVETDVRASADGVAFAFHDTDLQRVAATSDSPEAAFGRLSAAQVRAMSLDGGAPVPTIGELLRALPQTFFNIDVKTEDSIAPTVRAIEEAEAQDRVLIASFSHRRLSAARRLLPGVATSASPREVASLALGIGPLRGLARRHGAVCVQVPETYRGRVLVTHDFIRAAHANGLQVHVWTVDEPADIERLLDAGVDGLITDRPDVLKDVLEQRGQWVPA